MLHNYRLTDTAQKQFTADEIALINDSHTAVTADMNQQRVLSDIYSAKLIKNAVEDFVESNDKHSSAMKWLTIFLVVATVVQAAVAVVQLIVFFSTNGT